jgi:hypothetical protein
LTQCEAARLQRITSRWSAEAVLGADIFVSYARADAISYADGLAAALLARNMAPQIDLWDSTPGAELPAALIAALRHSRMLVIIGSPEAIKSPNVKHEIETFLETGGRIVPIGFSDALIQTAPWYRLIQGLPITYEPPSDILRTGGKPSEMVVNRIENAMTFVRRADRLKRATRALLAAITLLGIVGTGFMAYSFVQATRVREIRQEHTLAVRDRDQLRKDIAGLYTERERINADLSTARTAAAAERNVAVGRAVLNTAASDLSTNDPRRITRGAEGILEAWRTDPSLYERRTEIAPFLVNALSRVPRLHNRRHVKWLDRRGELRFILTGDAQSLHRASPENATVSLVTTEPTKPSGSKQAPLPRRVHVFSIPDLEPMSYFDLGQSGIEAISDDGLFVSGASRFSLRPLQELSFLLPDGWACFWSPRGSRFGCHVKPMDRARAALQDVPVRSADEQRDDRRQLVVTDGAELVALGVSRHNSLRVAWSADEKFVAAMTSEDDDNERSTIRRVSLWNAGTGEELSTTTLYGCREDEYSLAVSRSGILTAAACGGAVTILTRPPVDRGDPAIVFRRAPDAVTRQLPAAVTQLAFDQEADGILGTATSDGKVQVHLIAAKEFWNAAVLDEGAAVTSLALRASDDRVVNIVAVVGGHVVRLSQFDARELKTITRGHVPGDDISLAASMHEGKYLVVVNKLGVDVWQTELVGAEVGATKLAWEIDDLLIDATGDIVTCISREHSARWRVRSGDVDELKQRPETISTGDSFRDFQSLKRAFPRIAERLKNTTPSDANFWMRNDGAFVAVAEQRDNGRLRLYDRNGELPLPLALNVHSVVFGSGDTMAATQTDGVVWGGTFSSLVRLAVYNQGISAMALSADGSRLAVASGRHVGVLLTKTDDMVQELSRRLEQNRR